MPHIHKLIDFTVAAYIVYDRKVLLVDHKKLKTWMPVGGHVELDEDPIEALVREIQEESGLDVEIVGGQKAEINDSRSKELVAPLYMDIHPIDDVHRHVGLIYFAQAKNANVQLAEEEHHAFRWFSETELADESFNILPQVQFYSRQALAKLEN